MSGVTLTIGVGGGITSSGALLLKTVSAGTSGVSRSVTMGTGDTSSGSSGIMILQAGSAVSSTGGSIIVSVGSGENGVVLLEYPEVHFLVEGGGLEEGGWWVVL